MGSHVNESTRSSRGTVGNGVFMWSIPRGSITRTPAELLSEVSQSKQWRLGGWCEIASCLEVSQLEQEFRVMEYQPAGNRVSAEAEESPLIEATTRNQLMETITG
jgi:hypothetical protein